jgi:hypothetical protein
VMASFEKLLVSTEDALWALKGGHGAGFNPRRASRARSAGRPRDVGPAPTASLTEAIGPCWAGGPRHIIARVAPPSMQIVCPVM